MSKHQIFNNIRFSLLFFILQLILCSFPSTALSKKEHLVYFCNTDDELNVYKIYGKKPGKTLMLIGGIQGNEPGGFLSADLYTDMSLKKGNLIVVPRANFYSILRNHRGPRGDMNRKFTYADNDNGMQDKIVNILKKLIQESDYLLNLHDGAGYYHPEYIDKWRNPLRFGQSIIIDYRKYNISNTNKKLDLAKMAQKVIDEINPQIPNDLYKFHLNCTDTDKTDSHHKEQRKSATYYALTKHNIPSFGIETSKFLPEIDLKVHYHNIIINSFMKLFGIIPEFPSYAFKKPLLKYLVVSVNGNTPIVVNNNQAINLEAGDSINISHIEANYERGLSIDILKYGDLNDYRKDFIINKNTDIIVRKENLKFAEIPIRISQTRSIDGPNWGGRRIIKYFVVSTNGHRILISDGETLNLVKGDTITLIDVLSSKVDPSEMIINFKGFVGNKIKNTGEDRGYKINTGRDLIKRFSIKKQGEFYEITASIKGKKLGGFFVQLNPAILDYLLLKVNDNKHMVLRLGETIPLSKTDKIHIEEIKTNLHDQDNIHFSINEKNIKKGENYHITNLIEFKKYQSNHQLTVTKDLKVIANFALDIQSP